MVRVPLLDPPAPPVESEPETPAKPDSQGWSYVTETLVLAGSGDKLRPGVGQLLARQECQSIGVRNLGPFDVIVCSGQANDRPESLYGPGTAIVRSGEYVVLRMPGKFHAFYGFPGHLVEVTRFEELQPPFASQGQALWAVVYSVASLGLGTTDLFSTFWGTPANYGGFTARETGGANPVTFTIRQGTASDPGDILADVRLNAGGSTEEDDTNILCVTDSIHVDFLGGGGTLQFSLRAR